MARLVNIKAEFIGGNVTAEKKGLSSEMYGKSRYGEVKDKKIRYSLVEAAYLLEKKKMNIVDSKNKKLKFDTFIRIIKKKQKNFWVRYCVFRDLRDRGYIVKTALKFGADFRVYDRGKKPGEEHAKWIVYPVYETDSMTMHEFSAKNRVAHSTRKKLLLAVVDEEDEVSYWQIEWIKP